MEQSSTGRSHMRTLATMAAILAVCAVAFFASNAVSQSLNATKDQADQALLPFSTDGITTISWSYDGGDYTLTCEDNTWKDGAARDVAVDQDSAGSVASALGEAMVSRRIPADGIADEMGLGNPTVTATVAAADGTEISFAIGAQAADGESYYVSVDGEDGACIVDSSLGYLFTTMMDLYQKDASPAADTVDSLTLERADGSALSLSYDPDGVDDSYTVDYTWSIDDGTQRIATSHSKANALVTLVNNVSWSSLVSVDGVQDGAYGFDNPTLVATLSYTTNSEEETGETDDNGEAVTETVETPHTFVLTVGAQADDDGYYATVEGSSKVYTVSQSDVESLLEASVDSLRDDSVCLMDWDTVDSIDITAGGQTKTLAITRTEETDDDGDTETVASYTLDGESLEDVDAEELLDAIDAFEAEGEGSASSAAEGSPELSFVFHRNTETFSEMTLSFTRYDNNFYLVSFNGEERLLVNRNAVADLTDMVSGW